MTKHSAKSVKLPVTKNAIESIIKHMPDRSWQLRRGHPQFLLPLRSTLTKRHPILSITQYQAPEQDSANSSSVQGSQTAFFNGLLGSL